MKKCCFTQIPPVVHVLHHIYISGNRPEVGTNRKDDGLKDCKNAASLRRKVGTIQIFLGSLVIVPAYAKNRTNFRVHPPLAPYFCRFLPLRSHLTQKVFASHRHSLPLARYLNKLFLILKFSSPLRFFRRRRSRCCNPPPPYSALFLYANCCYHFRSAYRNVALAICLSLIQHSFLLTD